MSTESRTVRQAHLESAVERLREAIARYRIQPDDFVRDSLIKRFEFTYELAWKCAQDWLRKQHPDVDERGPQRILTAALERGLIEDGDGWTFIQRQRNLTVHSYGQKLAIELADNITARVLPLFEAMVARLQAQR